MVNNKSFGYLGDMHILLYTCTGILKCTTTTKTTTTKLLKLEIKNNKSFKSNLTKIVLSIRKELYLIV